MLNSEGRRSKMEGLGSKVLGLMSKVEGLLQFICIVQKQILSSIYTNEANDHIVNLYSNESFFLKVMKIPCLSQFYM